MWSLIFSSLSFLPRAAGQSVRIPKANIVEGLHLKGGDIVTLEYDTVFREVPVDPVIARVRSDTLWDNIVDESTRASTNKGIALHVSFLFILFRCRRL